MVKKYYTGELANARLCHIENTDICFLYSDVVMHSSDKYVEGDWFASSYIVNVEVDQTSYYFETRNSVYKVKSYTPLIINDNAIELIRTGFLPEIAVQIKTTE